MKTSMGDWAWEKDFNEIPYPQQQVHRSSRISSPKDDVIPQNFLFGFAKQGRKRNLCGISFNSSKDAFQKEKDFNEIPHKFMFRQAFGLSKTKFCGMTDFLNERDCPNQARAT